MTMDDSIIKEACVETVDQCKLAEEFGADRLELCRRLDLDGLTPNQKTIKQAIESVSIPLKVMIRPREGNFIYNTEELIIMEKQIDLCKSYDIKEVVLGLLTPKKVIDFISIQRLVDRAFPMSVTFHKAIDQTLDILKELDRLALISGVSSILTSGGKNTAKDGSQVLRDIIENFGNRFNIIAAGSITKDNLPILHYDIKSKEYHGRKIVGHLNHG